MISVDHIPGATPELGTAKINLEIRIGYSHLDYYCHDSGDK